MTKRMLIEATHPEETRVVVIDGKKLDEFDYESATKRQLKGNIYLAKITRVEPSLQAAFVEYGGNRHGFLAFSEIHPDYYRIPVEDREAILAEHAAMQSADDHGADGEEDLASNLRSDINEARESRPATDIAPEDDDVSRPGDDSATVDEAARAADDTERPDEDPGSADSPAMPLLAHSETLAGPIFHQPEADESHADDSATAAPADAPREEGDAPFVEPESGEQVEGSTTAADQGPAPRERRRDVIETVGGDEAEEMRRRPNRPHRRYKIQEVIKRRQILLVQVTKEERGNKGAALTTYLSLAGRYCVLMPNTGRGGGISRKITSLGDRKRLKSILEEFEIPDGMAVIVRTAGSERNKTELRRDYEYLLRLWDEIREHTLKSTAPALIYEEASLIKRAIRDLYSRDIEEVLVEGEEAYKAAKNFMRMLMPSHAKRVQFYKDPSTHLLQHYQVESQLDAIHNPIVHLKSGGYIVLNATEALVAIDVNSGRATRERNIEETALRTNLEAADEVARQLRLRDLAGLIVIDFIDMEESRNNAAVERRLKEAMRGDRARIQVGRISAFGLLELSRQRLRPSLIEASTELCRHCRGTGHVRSTESTALHVLRAIEEEGARARGGQLTVSVPTAVALYILNNKRAALAEIEARHVIRIVLAGDESLIPPDHKFERSRAVLPPPEPRQPVSQTEAHVEEEAEETEPEESIESGTEPSATEQPRGHDHEGRRRSRRRRRRRDEGRPPQQPSQRRQEPEPAGMDAAPSEPSTETETGTEATPAGQAGHSTGDESGQRRRRRRGRRGGRRRRRGEQRGGEPMVAHGFNGGSDTEHQGSAQDHATPEYRPSEPAEIVPHEREDYRHEHSPPNRAEREVDRPSSAQGSHEAVPFVTSRHDEPAAATSRAEETRDDDSAAASPRKGWWKRLVE